MPLAFLAARSDKELLALSASPHTARACSLLQTRSLSFFSMVRLRNATRFGPGTWSALQSQQKFLLVEYADYSVICGTRVGVISGTGMSTICSAIRSKCRSCGVSFAAASVALGSEANLKFSEEQRCLLLCAPASQLGATSALAERRHRSFGSLA